MLLAIDTSTRYAGVALLNDMAIVQLLQWRSHRNHTVELISAIEMIIAREHASASDLTAIAVAVGPGNFSALRVGLSVAKGFAWSMGIPLVSVTTLEAEAYPYKSYSGPVCAVLDAGREQVSWALFEESNGHFRQSSEEKIASPEHLVREIPPTTLLCGEGIEKHADALFANTQPQLRWAEPYIPSQRVSGVAYLGSLRLQMGQIIEASIAQPLYLRQPTITSPRQPVK